MMISTSFLLSVVVIYTCFCQYISSTIVRIGNDVIPANSITRGPAGLIKFIGADVTINSTLFAIEAYFISNASMSLQVWRPLAGGNSSSSKPQFRLIAVWPLVTRAGTDVQQIYIRNLALKCARVEPGDTLAAYFPELSAPLPYTFNIEVANQQLYTATTDPGSPPRVGDVLQFDNLIFPYEFSIRAYLYQNDSVGAAPPSDDCPNVLIPSYVSTVLPTTTTAPPTGYPGATGFTGPQGPTGNIGRTGLMGGTGATGSPGSAGEPGSTGIRGPDGVMGATGATGGTGSAGDTGNIGAPGVIGATGGTGGTGPRGARGVAAVYTAPTTSTVGTTVQPSTPQADQSLSNPQGDAWWRSRSLLKGIYAWLAILSFLSLIALIWSLILCAHYFHLSRAVKRDYTSSASTINAFFNPSD